MKKKVKKETNMSIIIVILAIVIVSAIIVLGFVNVYRAHIFTKNESVINYRKVIDGKEILSGVDIVTLINRVDNINDEEKNKFETEVLKKDLKNSRKLLSEDDVDKEFVELKVFIELKNEKRKKKEEPEYLKVDSKKIIENGGEKFIEFFGKQKFHRTNIEYNENGKLKAITYRIIL